MAKTSGYPTERPMASRLDYGVSDKMQIHLRLPPCPSVDLADERQERQPEGCPARDEETRRTGSNQETSSICALQEVARAVDEYVAFDNYERINLKNGLTPFEIRSKAAKVYDIL